ncbi:uncharacterized protein PG986_002730 [Apiospora aurea]|uniref:Uncharacterized protein n=1 Tax=Apiospora aurea TaxID=335848 RepID=A0ABR1QPM6_9PEZI
MKTSFLLALLPAAAVVLGLPNHYARQDAPSTVTLSTTAEPPASTSISASTSTTPTATTPAEELPCPTNPPNCAAKLDGHLVCMAGGVWCRYTDATAHWTPGFYPVNYAGPCPPCLPSF